VLKARVYPWLMGQLDALTVERTRQRRADVNEEEPPVPRADIVRDVLAAGLVALWQEGVRAPGFAPGRAVLEAHNRGETTGSEL